ncbi:RDD family protein [Microbacterium murale]|uniref:RDD family membrane protein YckC n=1 Tax=Microbacterium murale TaxID=1081040 RepID=A0ABU0P9P7_9MICO|nr:RDD family protein [Microbacterium murale]MDQ0644054.1 putative RDD family membrane protein YckC [Microbacterium murale]
MTQLAFGTVAPTSRRAVAYLIDAAIAAGIGLVLGILLIVFATIAGPEGMLGVLAIGGPVVWLMLVGWLVFYTFMQTRNGSIGMRAQGLRLVSETDGAPLGFGRALLRNVIFWLAASIVVGYFTPLFDGSGRFQGWHDKVARSLMLDARTGSASVAAPVTQAMHIPPRPVIPNAVPPLPGRGASEPAYFSQTAAASAAGVPPVPGLTPAPSYSSPESIAYDALVGPNATQGEPAPALDETIPAPRLPQPAPYVPQTAPHPPQQPAGQQPAGQPPIAQPPVAATGEDSLIAFVPGITQDGPPERSPEAPAAPPIPVAAPAHAPAAPPAQPASPVRTPSDEIGDIEDTRISIPGHRLVFTWDDGTRVTVSQRTLFGRNPAPEEGAVAVIVRDETLSLSKTHFEAAAEASGGWVKDRHSTNGTVIVRDGERIPCSPGEAVRIRLGDAIEIGDRIVTIGGYA